MNHDHRINAKVYYQDFSKNIDAHFGKDPVIYPESVLIGSYPVFAETEEGACEELFVAMNHIDERFFDCKLGRRESFKQAGHTSMSVGDYVEFPDTGNIYICKSIGWHVIPGKTVKAKV